MKNIQILFLSITFLSISATSAQTATPVVNQRQINQHERIKEGKRTGQLTPQETRRLKAREMKIQHDKKIAKSDGVVTPKEKNKLRLEQNRASKAIATQKHD